jgi:hypothetical protein
VTVPAVIADDTVAFLQIRTDPGRDRLLADIGVDQPGHRAIFYFLARSFVKAADGQHGAIQSNKRIVIYSHYQAPFPVSVTLLQPAFRI